MHDALNRIGALVAELESIGCAVSVADAAVTVTIRYPVPVDLDPGTAQRIVDEIAAEPPAPKPVPVPRARPTTEGRAERLGPPKIDYAEVARVACEAIAAGNSGAVAVMKHFGIKRAAADMRISAARQRGHDIPRGAPKPPAAKPEPPTRPTFTPDDATRILEDGDGDDDA